MERTESTERERTNSSPEVPEKPVRRRFTVEYKVKIFAEADADASSNTAVGGRSDKRVDTLEGYSLWSQSV